MSDRTATPIDVAVGFGRTLRAAGVPVTSGRLTAFVDALAQLDPESRSALYWAGRATLCSAPDHVARYDAAFDAYFSGVAPHRRLRQGAASDARPPLRSIIAPLTETPDAEEDDEDDDLRMTVGASSADLLRQRDLASLTPADREQVNRMLARLSLAAEPRRIRRTSPWHRGSIDRQRTMREALHGQGDPRRVRHRRPRRRPRDLVLLVDVSGSMSVYADALLRFAHVALLSGRRGGALRRVEAFTLGSRLTRITEPLRQRDPDSAMAAVAGTIPDWSGGTRLGAGLKEWLATYGQRGMARGAVVIIMSDGWERDDPAVLGEQMARLQRLAHKVIWSNPRKAAVGFQPTTGGMAAARPHVDVFLSGHSLAALDALADAASGRSPATRR